MSKRREIIQVVSKMDVGGVETWLMHVLRHIDRNRFHFIFCTASHELGFFGKEIRSLGGDIVHCPAKNGYRRFAKQFVSILNKVKPDVVHSHFLFLSGLVVRLAKNTGVPIRIVHSHASRDGHPDSVRRFFYRWLMRRCIRKYATHGIGCSAKTADYLFAPDWRNRNGYQVATCAIDTVPFRKPVDRVKLLRKFDIPANAKIVGHIGGFRHVKNHKFLLQVAAEIRKHEDIHLFLVGDGPLRSEIEMLANGLGISSHVTFAGVRDDVPALLEGLFDLLIFPSKLEGLPLVVVESQAAGVPCLISDVITAEVTVIPELIHRESLNTGPKVWAERALELLSQAPYDEAQALQRIENSKFSISSSVGFLTKLYLGQLSS